MTSQFINKIADKYNYYDKALASCLHQNIKSDYAYYTDKPHFERKVIGIFTSGIDSTYVMQKLNAECKTLHDSAFHLWRASIDQLIISFNADFESYEKFYKKHHKKIDILKNASGPEKYKKSISTYNDKYTSLGEVPLSLTDYITEDWEKSFKDLNEIDAGLNKNRDEMLDFHIKAKEERDKKRLFWLRIIGWGGTPSGAAGYWLVDNWETVCVVLKLC